MKGLSEYYDDTVHATGVAAAVLLSPAHDRLWYARVERKV